MSPPLVFGSIRVLQGFKKLHLKLAGHFHRPIVRGGFSSSRANRPSGEPSRTQLPTRMSLRIWSSHSRSAGESERRQPVSCSWNRRGSGQQGLQLTPVLPTLLRHRFIQQCLAPRRVGQPSGLAQRLARRRQAGIEPEQTQQHLLLPPAQAKLELLPG